MQINNELLIYLNLVRTKTGVGNGTAPDVVFILR